MRRALGTAAFSDGITSTQELSAVLFTKLLLPFEVTSVLILIAILGAVALARHGDGDSGTTRKDGRQMTPTFLICSSRKFRSPGICS